MAHVPDSGKGWGLPSSDGVIRRKLGDESRWSIKGAIAGARETPLDMWVGFCQGEGSKLSRVLPRPM